MTMDLFIDIAVKLGSFGVVAWLVWYTYTRTIPALVNDFRADLDTARSLFRNALAVERERSDTQRHEFLAALKEEREAFAAEIKANREWCHMREHRSGSSGEIPIVNSDGG